MKKTIKGLLTVTAIFALGACTPDEKESHPVALPQKNQQKYHPERLLKLTQIQLI